MRYKKVVLITVALGLLILSAPVAAQIENVSGNESLDENASESDDANESVGDADQGVPMGLMIASVVASEKSAVHNRIDRAKFNIEFERNETNAINNRTTELLNRIKEKKQLKEQIKEEYRSGDISEAEYRVQSASVESELNELNESVNDTVNKSSGLDVAAQNGVNTSAIMMLKESARNLGGQSVSQIARSIAGPPEGVGPDFNDTRRGPPMGVGGDNGNESGGPPDGVGREDDGNESGGPPGDQRRGSP